MNPVLFVVHGDMRMSRRFRTVIDVLNQLPDPISSFVLSTTNQIQQLRDTLPADQAAANLEHWSGKGSNEMIPRQHHQFAGASGDPSYGERALRVMPHLPQRLEELQKAYLPRWQSLCRLAHACLLELKPSLVVYDLEMVDGHRALILAARDKGIPVLSMQHAEGFGHTYRHFPRLADGYIAYSQHNREIMLGMGVPAEAIHLTGNPDTDEVYSMDHAAMRADLEQKHGLSREQRRILVTLKPNLPGKYSAQNRLLLKLIQASQAPVQWLLKPHPVDKILNLDSTLDHALIRVPAEDSVVRWMAAADHLLGFYSSCVVEAALMNLPATIVHDPGVSWPDWHREGTFHYIQASQLEDAIAQIHQAPRHIEPAARNAFIERVRFRFDGGAAGRVAAVAQQMRLKTPAGSIS